MYIGYQFIRNLESFCSLKKFIFTHTGKLCDLAVHFSHMADCLNDITGSGLTLCTDHGSTFIDAAECLSKIFCTAYKRNFEFSFINMINIISRRKNFTFINIVDLNGFQYLCFHKMSDTAFGHNRNGNCVLDPFDHFRVTHSGNTACCTDIGRNTLQGHNRTGTGSLGNFCLLRCCDIHDHTAL